MTKRKNHPSLKNGKYEVTGMPPHFIDEKNKEVILHIPGGFPVVMAIPIQRQTAIKAPNDMTMKTIKLNPVAFQMALEISKKQRKSIETYLADLITANYQGAR